MDYLGLFPIIFGLANQVPVLDRIMIWGAVDGIYLTFFLSALSIFRGGPLERKSFVIAIFSLPIAIILIRVIHFFYIEPRPFITYTLTPLIAHVSDPSFPSTHTTITAVVTFPYLFYKSKWTPLFVFFLAWVGFSRIYVGVHLPIDILGGILTGLTVVSITWLVKKEFLAGVLSSKA